MSATREDVATMQVLERARDTIADPDDWTSGAVARDDNGHRVAPWDPDAVCWCLVGALDKAATDLCLTSSRAYTLASQAARDLYRGSSVAVVNDNRGHTAAIRVLDEAIRRAS